MSTAFALPASALHVENFDNYLRVYFSSEPGDHADFHYQWLRHNCDHDRHPFTKERVVCSSELSPWPRPHAVHFAGTPAALHIRWAGEPERQESVYPIAYLREHAYAYGRRHVATPPSDVTPLLLDARSVAPEALPGQVLSLVRAHGLAVVRNYGLDTESIIDNLAKEGLTIRGTHFGRIEDLRTDNSTNQNTDQLGYTNYPVKLHTDQPFLEDPPVYQLLQCMRKAVRGGENYVVDAYRAARYIEATDRQAFQLLTRQPIIFHRKQKAFEKTLVSPLLNFSDPKGFTARYSYFTMAPHKAPFDIMENWYQAYKVFADLVNDPRNQYHVALEEGDFLMYNNRRMLHARNGFDGARWMRGIYFDEAAAD